MNCDETFQKSTNTLNQNLMLSERAVGSVLFPFLWNILIDNLVRNDFHFPYEFVGFADDWTLLTSDNDSERARRIYNQWL